MEADFLFSNIWRDFLFEIEVDFNSNTFLVLLFTDAISCEKWKQTPQL